MGKISWKSQDEPIDIPESGKAYMYIGSADGLLTLKLDTGEIIKYATTSEIGSILSWLNKAKDFYDPTSGLPSSPTVGDRYIANATANGWVDTYVYEWSGAEWSETATTDGDVIVLSEPDPKEIYIKSGSSLVDIETITSYWSRTGTTLTPKNTGDGIEVNGGDILTANDGVDSIGSDTNRFAALWLSGSSLHIGNTDITETNVTGTPVYLGGQSGLNDLVSSGTYTDETNPVTFQVYVDGISGTDTFKWRKGTGAWTDGIPFQGLATPVLLSDGIYIAGAINGHKLNDGWFFGAGERTRFNKEAAFGKLISVDGDIIAAGSVEALGTINANGDITHSNGDFIINPNENTDTQSFIFRDEDDIEQLRMEWTPNTDILDFSGLATVNFSALVTAITQSAGDSSTKVATTAYVDSAVGVENLWNRVGTTLSTHFSGDNVSIGGDLNVTATNEIVLDNTSVTGEINMDLGTDSSATSFNVRNNSLTDLFTVLGEGHVGVGGPPSTRMDIYQHSNLIGLRIRGITPAEEIGDIYMQTDGRMVFDLGSSLETSPYFDFQGGPVNIADNIGIGTTTIPHGGIGHAKLAIEGTDSSTTAGPHIQITTDTDDYPLFQMLNVKHDEIAMNFDSYLETATWKSSDAGSNFQIYKLDGILRFRYDSGIAAGSAVAWNEGFQLDASGNFQIGDGDFSATLDVIGNAEINGTVQSKASTRGSTDFYLREPVSGTFGLGTLDAVIPGVLVLDRAADQQFFNIVGQGAQGASTPYDTEWNSSFVGGTSGFSDLSDVKTRTYTTFKAACNNAIGDNIIGLELVMHVISTDQYYKALFSTWGSGTGTWTWTRTEISFEDRGLYVSDGADPLLEVDNIVSTVYTPLRAQEDFAVAGNAYFDADTVINQYGSLIIGNYERETVDGFQSNFQVLGGDEASGTMTLAKYEQNEYEGPTMQLYGSWGSFVGSNSKIGAGVGLGRFQFYGDNNGGPSLAAEYYAESGTFASGQPAIADFVWEQTDTGVAMRETMRLSSDAGLSLINGTSINEFSIDGTLAGDSDDAVPTEKAVKTYVDGHSSNNIWTRTGTDVGLTNTNDDVTLEDTYIENGHGLVIGHNSQITASDIAELQLLGTSAIGDSSFLTGMFSNDANEGMHYFLKSRAASIGDKAIVQDNDKIGSICWIADDGIDYTTEIARFYAEVDDSTPAEGDIGGAFVWQQNAGGGGGINETMRLAANGNLAVDTDTLFVDASTDRVGIGTDSPNDPLHIYAGADNSLQWAAQLHNYDATDSGGSAVGLLFSVDTNYSRGKGGIAFERLDSFGRGSIHFLQDNVADTNRVDINNKVMTIDMDGNVDVIDGDVTISAGRIIAQGSGTGANNFIGGTSGGSLTDGTNNVLIGEPAGTNVESGDNNILIGRNSGSQIVDENYNVLIGYNTGFSAPGLDTSVGIGTSALRDADDAINTTAIGSFAGRYATGTDGVYLGYTAGESETENSKLWIGNNDGDLIEGSFVDGWLNIHGDTTVSVDNLTVSNGYVSAYGAGGVSSNFCGGNNSGTSLTEGSLNTLVGYSSGNGITTGDQNTLLGYNSGNGFTYESFVTAVGSGAAGGAATTLNRAVAFGAQALSGASSSQYTVAIGMGAGRDASSQDSVFLGYQVGEDETENRKLIIGNRYNNLIEGSFYDYWMNINSSINTPYGGFGRYQNLCRYSEDLSLSPWIDYLSYVTIVTDNATAPNGETTADTVTWDTLGRGLRHINLGLVNGQTYTVSFWASAVTQDSQTLEIDLGDGTAGSVAVLSGQMRRYSVTLTATANDWMDLEYNGTAGDAFEFWGFQVNDGSIPYNYLKTTDVILDTEGIGASITGDLYVSAPTGITLDNTNITGDTNIILGSDTATTAFNIKNNSLSDLFTVDGSGDLTIENNLTINEAGFVHNSASQAFAIDKTGGENFDFSVSDGGSFGLLVATGGSVTIDAPEIDIEGPVQIHDTQAGDLMNVLKLSNDSSSAGSAVALDFSVQSSDIQKAALFFENVDGDSNGRGNLYLAVDQVDDTNPINIGDAVLTANYSDGSVNIANDLNVTGAVTQDNTIVPTLLDSLIDNTNFDGINAIHTVGKYAYAVSFTADSFSVISLEDPSSLVRISTLTDGTNLNGPYGVHVVGNYAYVGTYNSGDFVVIDISDKTNPTIVGTGGAGGGYGDLFVAGQYAYTTDYDGNSIEVINVADPTNPYSVTVIDGDGLVEPTLVHAQGNFLYCTSLGDDALHIYDISDPPNISHVGKYTSATYINGAWGLAISGQYAYVTGRTSNSVAIIDVSDPTAPSYVGSYTDATNMNGAKGVYLSGDLLYVACDEGKQLTVVDVSDPTSPSFVNKLTDATNLDGCHAVELSGQYAYVVSDNSNSICSIDIQGTKLTSASIGSMEVNRMHVLDDATIAGQLDVSSSMIVGENLNVHGTATANGTQITTQREDYNQTSGWLFGGQVTVNGGDNTLIDIAAGTIRLVDYATDTTYRIPTFTTISWAAQTALDPGTFGRSIWVGVEDNGSGVANFVFEVGLTPTIMRDSGILCRLLSNTGDGQISSVLDFERPNWGLTNALQDWVLQFGSYTIEGNKFTPNDTNLLFDRGNGTTNKTWRYHTSDTKGAENVHTESAATGITAYNYHLQGEDVTTLETDIDPDNYDVSGTKTSVTSDYWTIQEIWYFPTSGTTHVIYGQAEYDSKVAALIGLDIEDKVRNTEILDGAIFRTYVLIQEGSTNLDEAIIIQEPVIGKPSKGQGRVPTFSSRSYAISDYGSNDNFYAAGFYEAPSSDVTLTIGGTTTQTLGTATKAEAAHAFCVASGLTIGSNLTLTVSGTSITDAGVRTTSDSEIIVANAHATVADEYFETSKKWLGQITYTLTGTSGAFAFNYGFAKYEDFGNRDFTATDFECVGLAALSADDLNIEFLHHQSTGWTYHPTAFIPGSTSICEMLTDYSTDVDIESNEYFAYKRSNLSTDVAGSSSEGVLVRMTQSTNNAIRYGTIQIGVLI